MSDSQHWDQVVKPKTSLLDLNIKEVIDYIDLLKLFVKRDVVTLYKQTVLGPVWYFIQPIFTAGIFTFVFGNIAKISTDGNPKVLFYLSGLILWNYFSESLIKTSSTFISNQSLFGKVYFPRLIMPLSTVVSGLLKFIIQFMLFLCFYSYYFNQGLVNLNIFVLFIPVIVLNLALISTGFGMIFSSLTTKYRDLNFLLGFGVQLWMYATPIIYPSTAIPKKYLKFIDLNPVTHLVEAMRYSFFDKGTFNYSGLTYSFIFGLMIFFLGYIIFNKFEKNFMDTI